MSTLVFLHASHFRDNHRRNCAATIGMAQACCVPLSSRAFREEDLQLCGTRGVEMRESDWPNACPQASKQNRRVAAETSVRANGKIKRIK